ncbi:unnamed protein product, partial [Rotaria sp. Silwood2]
MSIEAQTILVFLAQNSTHFHATYTTQFIATNLDATITLFIILWVISNINPLIQFILRFCLPAKVHPTLYDVLPSPPNITDYPIVAVQLPMRNEIECCAFIIGCACKLDWPKTRLLIQVLDDSTDEPVMTLIDQCVDKWSRQGVQINVIRRPDRKGFKAGNLAHG